MVRIENWSVVTNATPYTAPEAILPHLQGNVYGHPNFGDGDFVHTSHIVRAEGRKIQTWSGHIYLLGEVNPEYKEAYPDRDLDGPEPIKMKTMS